VVEELAEIAASLPLLRKLWVERIVKLAREHFLLFSFHLAR
jgi:hypothetical protein